MATLNGIFISRNYSNIHIEACGIEGGLGCNGTAGKDLDLTVSRDFNQITIHGLGEDLSFSAGEVQSVFIRVVGGSGGRGIEGAPGHRGGDGQSGSYHGASGNCGWNGEPGGPGGNGGNGGRGGHVTIRLQEKDRDLKGLFTIYVNGGKGGAGGPGGPGGEGGRGGDGAAPYTSYSDEYYIDYKQDKVFYSLPHDHSGGDRGRDGIRGIDGINGNNGADGENGSYQFMIRTADGVWASEKPVIAFSARSVEPPPYRPPRSKSGKARVAGFRTPLLMNQDVSSRVACCQRIEKCFSKAREDFRLTCCSLLIMSAGLFMIAAGVVILQQGGSAVAGGVCLGVGVLCIIGFAFFCRYRFCI